MNFILLAPPAAGKGTIALLLKNKYNYVTISSGDLLRNIDEESELGKEIRELQAHRKLISDDLINELIKERLSHSDCKEGFILDGYPRAMSQVHALEEILNELSLKIDKAILLNVSYETALKRTLGRAICSKCKRSYNNLIDGYKPKSENICDVCNTPLKLRNDDNEETFKKGYELYNNTTALVVDYYRERNMLIELNAEEPMEEIVKDLEVLIKK